MTLLIGGPLVMTLLSAVVFGQNRDTVIGLVGDFMRGMNWNCDGILFDHSEVTLALADLEDKVNIMAKDLNAVHK